MQLSRETAQGLAEVIHGLCGLVLGENKDYLIRHRLEPLVRREGLAGFDQFLTRLTGRDGARLHDDIVEAITTKETSFYRDRAFFDALQNTVLPTCVDELRNNPARHRIRIWCAACSTGQEPYSLAMLIRDRLPPAGPAEERFSILASDISADAIESARSGWYSQNEIERGLPEDARTRHFSQTDDGWRMNEAVRRMVQFQRIDLLQLPASLGAFDLILCRNLLIYFDDQNRRRVCKSLFDVMYPGAWLAVGAAESLHGVEDRLETVRIGRMILYRKPQTA